MGEKLVVSIVKNNKTQEEPLIKVYYYNRAYTSEAYYESNKFVKEFKKVEDKIDFKNKRKLIFSLVKIFENIGARIDIDDYDYVKKEYPELDFLKTDIDRNKGLIALSKEDMEDMEKIKDGGLTIFLEEREVLNNVFWGGFESIEKFNEEYGEQLTKEELERNELDYDILEATFDNIEDRIEQIEKLPYYFYYNNRIWCFAE